MLANGGQINTSQIPAPLPLGEVTPRSGVRSQPCCEKGSRQHYPEHGVLHTNFSPFMHADGVVGGQPVFGPSPLAALLLLLSSLAVSTSADESWGCNCLLLVQGAQHCMTRPIPDQSA